MIEFSNVGKVFGKKNALIKALNGISFKIENGEMVSVVGPSGSGKSTLLNIIGLLDKQTGGDYCLNGKNINNFNDKELSKLRNACFGFVLQDYAIINDYTVLENVEIPINYSRNKENKKKRIEKVLEDLQILDKIKTKGGELSGGQSQRVAIARAIVNDPDVILADEPTGALDKNTGIKVVNILRKINKTGKTVIIVTHNEEIAKICDRIIKIEDGEIVNDVKNSLLNQARTDKINTEIKTVING
ncbi:MAG: ABC transporter ATP-binding protein [Oscillospiraceae bacterium]|nr:ABC transporter ATP-binding protein [Oscillospiraceae bacterium]